MTRHSIVKTLGYTLACMLSVGFAALYYATLQPLDDPSTQQTFMLFAQVFSAVAEGFVLTLLVHRFIAYSVHHNRFWAFLFTMLLGGLGIAGCFRHPDYFFAAYGIVVYLAPYVLISTVRFVAFVIRWVMYRMHKAAAFAS